MTEKYRKIKQKEAALAEAKRIAAMVDYNIMMGNLDDPEEDSDGTLAEI